MTLDLEIVERRKSLDSSTKYLMHLGDGICVEAIAFTLEDLPHICISTQAGCNVGCPFCETGKTKTRRNLSAAEITGQVTSAAADLGLSCASKPAFHDVSVAGMGEALLNFDALVEGAQSLKATRVTEKVTVTTSGIVPRIRQLASAPIDQLTISLHATTDAVRNRLVPVNRKYPIVQLIAAAKEFGMAKGSKVIANYLLFRDINDSPEDLGRLVDLLDPATFDIHLKYWNPVDGSGFVPSQNFEMFLAELLRHGFSARISRSAGTDIEGGCGQLRARAAADAFRPAIAAGVSQSLSLPTPQ
jgi:23S rRNA (adenine2503-C2)-methyltransferase